MFAALIQFLTGHAIAALMLAVGLQTPRSVFHDFSRRWALLLRALVVVWIAVPLLALATLSILRPREIGAGTLIIMTICPGVPLLMRKTGKAHGDTDTALLVMLATSLTSVVLLPVWTSVLARTTRYDLAIDPMQVATIVLSSVILPFVIGRIVRELSPRLAAPLARLANAVFIAGIAIFALMLLLRGIPGLRAVTLVGVAATVIVLVGAVAMGYLAGVPRRSDRIALAYAAALGNPALALAVIARSYPVLDALTAVAVFMIVRGLALAPFGIWLERGATARRSASSARVRGPLISPPRARRTSRR